MYNYHTHFLNGCNFFKNNFSCFKGLFNMGRVGASILRVLAPTLFKQPLLLSCTFKRKTCLLHRILEYKLQIFPNEDPVSKHLKTALILKLNDNSKVKQFFYICHFSFIAHCALLNSSIFKSGWYLHSFISCNTPDWTLKTGSS